ncbi:MAG TPA: sulfatase, partial [Longimicrobiaceae bacterium]|nr:sulfatase [Longimicrobiaceae bacterium]
LAAQQSPNIVFLLADDHAAHAISAYQDHLRYGADLPDTPNLDRLAASGMLFTNAFVTNSICGPSRAAILTGQYGHLNGVMTNAEALHPTTVTFPGLLQKAGYRTALFGKWHLKTDPTGFDVFEILIGQGPYYNPALRSATDTVRYEGYTNDIITRRAIDWMDKRSEDSQPFLMMLHFNAPHRYWDPGPEQIGMFRDTVLPEPSTFWDDGSERAFPTRDAEMTIALDLFARDLKLEVPDNLTPEQRTVWEAAYGEQNEIFRSLDLSGDAATRWKYQRFIKDYMRVVLALDAAVGELLDSLERSGLARNTFVVYMSDQGFFLGDHGWFDKRWMYEESLRTPLLVRWPDVVQPGSVNDDLVMNLDIAQTFLDIGGAAAPASMQGRSIVPLLRGSTPDDWRDAIYYQYFAYPDWHMVQRQYGVRTARYKLIHYYEAGKWELFDLARDPNEMSSVYADPQYADEREHLKHRLAELRDHYAVPAEDPVPHMPFDPPPNLRRAPGDRPVPTWSAGKSGQPHVSPGAGSSSGSRSH